MNKYLMNASVAFALVYAATMEAEVSDTRTIITIPMTGNGALSLSADSKPSIGDEIILKVSSDGTARDLTFGTGFTAPTLSGTISKTKVLSLVYDGTSFIATSAAVQIN
ncbi:MAG: hypothetical protein ITG00_03395 [Flavobacterium sp.]|nr:hypothetical protein [Flavobacterium sp.]